MYYTELKANESHVPWINIAGLLKEFHLLIEILTQRYASLLFIVFEHGFSKSEMGSRFQRMAVSEVLLCFNAQGQRLAPDGLRRSDSFQWNFLWQEHQI